MNSDIVEGKWKQFKGTVRARWDKLTDDHLDVITGKCDRLLGKIQETYGINKADAEGELKAFGARNKRYGANQAVHGTFVAAFLALALATYEQ
jgi:uncharacterized protein YjbJ (UPF0337 family)